MSVVEGDVIAGKYVVQKLLGKGGMGAVVAAHHAQLDQRVAIKFLLPEALEVPEAVARFTREARAATKIQSEHVVRIIDVGSLESGVPYMVMEYLSGRDLAALVREQGPLPVETVAEYLLQACEALAEAHAIGIIHRDLKPANLFLVSRMDGTPLVKVLDFGISKLTSQSSSGPDLGLTKTSASMGSPLYMSPEQMCSARDVDPRTDVWALGVVMYELLAGIPPFNGESLPELCAKVLQESEAPLRSVRPDLPPAAESIVARCLRKAPADRFANVAELAVALGELAPSHALPSVRRICAIIEAAGGNATRRVVPDTLGEKPDDVRPAKAGATDVSWAESRATHPARRRFPAVGVGVALLAAGAIALVGVSLMGRSKGEVASGAEAPAASSAPTSAAAPVQPSQPVPPVPTPEAPPPSAEPSSKPAPSSAPTSKPPVRKSSAPAKVTPSPRSTSTPSTGTSPKAPPSASPTPHPNSLGGRT
jgi:serine/threonine protein kinase